MTSLVDGFASHLRDQSMDIRSKLNIASELRDSIEINQVTADQDHFVPQLLPEITRLLEQTPVSMSSFSLEHKLRHCLLDILSRLQPSEALKPEAAKLLDLMVKIIKCDNEENGIVCMKVLTNLHRAYKSLLADHVQPFLDLVIELITNVPQLVHDLFDTPSGDHEDQNSSSNNQNDSRIGGNAGHNLSHLNTAGTSNPCPTPNPNGAQTPTPVYIGQTLASTPSGTSGAGNSNQAAQNNLFPAMNSFKVLTECPIIIVLLFTSHRQVIMQSLPVLIPHVIDILTLETVPQAREHAAAEARGTHFAGVAPALRNSPNRSAYTDFVIAQIKVMSFVAFIVRAFSHAMQQHLPLIPNFVVRLLKDCPPESSSARKELLVSLRHILNTEHRVFFLSKVSILLEERVLIGSGLTAHENLRPLAYSTVADLIHHVRNELTVSQIWQAVRVYTRNLLDMSLAAHYQGMCLKLLLNVLDRLTSMSKPDQGRQILLLVLKSVVDRMRMVNRQGIELEAAIRRSKDVINIHQEIPHCDIKDAKFVFRSLVLFLRSLIFGLKASNPPAKHSIGTAQWQEVARIFGSDGVQLFRQLLRESIQGFALYKSDSVSGDSESSSQEAAASSPPPPTTSVPTTAASISASPVSIPAPPAAPNASNNNQAVNDLMDALVAVYMQLDPATFNEVFEQEIEMLVEAVIERPEFLHITYLLTGNEATSPGFSAIMLQYLMKRIHLVGEPGGLTLLKLFKQCFSAVNVFPTANEAVIILHLRDLIVKSLELANDATEPSRYFSLLQHLFRTLGGGRFDSVYKTVLPLLYYLLETLNKRLSVARLEEERNVYADLCLTVPVRLSLMVPHLNFLMKPLTQALSATDNVELTSQGLRTLELCVDNLTAAYLDPHIEPVLSEILPSLWRLLKPLPFDHKLSHTTLRILGKLGGRSRANIMPPTDLRAITPLDQDVEAILDFETDTRIFIRITPGIKVALRILESPLKAYTAEYRVKAFKYLSVVLLKYFPSDPTGLDVETVQANKQGNNMMAEDIANAPQLPDASTDKEQRWIGTELVEQLLRGIFLACATDDTREDALNILKEICEHVVLLELGEFNLERRRALRLFDVNEHEGNLYIAPRTFVSSIVFALSHYYEGVSDAAIIAIRNIAAVGREICGEEVETHRYPMFRGVFAKLSHSCFEEAWYIKRGAIKGLGIIMREIALPKPWLGARVIELTRTLFFVIKDTSPVGGYWSGNVPSAVSQEAADLLMFMLSQVEHNPSERYFATLTGLLAFELESVCRFCRETAQRALRYLAEQLPDTTLNDTLQKVTDVFLTPIFMKPLRALPFPMQIGYSDCISFCLSLPDTFLKFNDKLTRLLEEVLALVDADDDCLTSAHRVFEHTTAQQLTELRVVCVKLLAQAATTSDQMATHNPSLRARIIAVFFKTMNSGQQSAVDAAYEGLKAVLKVSHRLPKELLQAGLKPILLPLSDYKRLNVSGLDCLARLLELLNYNFKVEIGTKLLDHLRTFAEPARLIPLSVKVLDGDERIKIGVALINVFHMLPPSAHVFIPQLMTSIVGIEDTLRRSQSSPFRPPAALFLDRYPVEAFKYFSEKLTDPIYGKFFSEMVLRAPKLAKYTSENIEELCNRIMTQPNEEDQCMGICNLISVASNVDIPRKVILNLVSSIADVVRATSSQPVTSELQISVPNAIDQLQRIVVTYLRKQATNPADVTNEHVKEDYDSMEGQEDSAMKTDHKANSDQKEKFELDFGLINVMLNAVATAEVLPEPQLLDYIWETVICSEDIQVKQSWIDNSIDTVVQQNVHPRAKQYLMSATNLLFMIFAERNNNSLNDLVGDSLWLKHIHEKVWQKADELMPPSGTIANPQGSGLGTSTLDQFFIQLIEMTVLLVQNASSKIVDMRKNVIKFGWRYITVEDAVSKLSAYVLVNNFVAAFDTLPKIVVQLYIALLKTPQQEARTLVQQSLDVLATVLVQRINSPLWARAPQRILSEDGHGIVGVSNVCLFLARHAHLFYPHREMYVQFIISALARLSFMSGQTLDVDLAELLAAWEEERYEKPENTGYEVPHSMREAVVTYLVRFITVQPASRSRDPRSAQRVLDALDKLLDLWPDAEVRLNFFDRALIQTDISASPQALASSLDALRVVDLALRHRSGEWIAQHVDEILVLVEKPLHSSLLPVHEALAPLLRRLLSNDPEEAVLRVAVNATTEHLAPTQSTTPRTVWVNLASEVMRAKPSCLDEQMGLAIKALSRIAKDRLENPTLNDPALLIDALKLVASRVSHLGDQRRAFLSLVAHVIELVQDKSVARFILDMVRGWVFGHEPFPTVKEKSAILHKLLLYKDPSLVVEYYDIIINVFLDPKLRATELPTRLEQPFLIGCTSSNVQVRTKLLSILNDSVDRVVGKRLVYALTEQNWEALADKNWLCQALQLILTPVKQPQSLDIQIPLGFAPVSVLQYTKGACGDTTAGMDVEPSADLIHFVERRKGFLQKLNEISATEFLDSLSTLLFVDSELVHETWIDVFPSVYKNAFADKERHELVKGIVMLLAKEYHLRQADDRPNVVQSLLTGLATAGDQVPPQLTKYLAANYNAWYTAIQICEEILNAPRSDSLKVAEVNYDALAELYAALGEDDHFYGLWRTRSKFVITSAALSYEQCGMWTRAMQLHETAQIRARSGVLAYGESEYSLWEDHWILCAEKLQHWEILGDIAKHEGFTDLLLECQWRLADWMADHDSLATTIKTVMDVPTPRRQVFETFLSLQGFAQKTDTLQHLSQNCDEGIQLALRKWHGLPSRFTQAHAPLLHTFQQYVEFMEATQVYTSLQATTALNLEAKSQELKGVMQAWHERLPNTWEDINWWGDLAAWRQHVFGVINRVYLPLIPQLQAAQGASGGAASNSSAAYRGYHEIAWTINRFAHTARKQNLPDVCVTQLSKIYTLPNIEIQEAFLKLREQAKCHLQNPNELATGLDVISNTNLAFFGNPQKAEFFALKGESLAKLGQHEHAFNVLSAAVQVDLHLPKAWAAWGEFSDRRFKEHPEEVSAGASAITCYLHAISQYKNRKSRKLIGRLLWLLGLEDTQGLLGKAFEEYKGETPTWYWVTYIPQLLTSLSQKESKFTSMILIKIAKAFPQALHFHLRTAREEYAVFQKLQQRQNQPSGAAKTDQAGSKESEESGNNSSTKSKAESSSISTDNYPESAANSHSPVATVGTASNDGTPKSQTLGSGQTTSSTPGPFKQSKTGGSLQPWEYTEEIMGVLKTAYPLLALSLETLIDQMNHRFKSPPDEDAYRLIVALLNDGLSFMGRQQCTREDQRLPPQTEANVSRFAEGVIPESTRPQFEADFVHPRPTLDDYIQRLRKWRNRLEAKLDARPYRINLEALSPPLGEFHYQKFEEIEVPGQNMELADDNRFFVKIGRFVPHVDLIRSYGICYRRITIQATDGSLHPFAVQYPAARNCRREERVSQVFKFLDSVMQHRTEVRRRNIKFTLPNAVPLNMHIRMVQDDSRYVSFHQIYEKYCREKKQSRDAPFDYVVEQMRASFDPTLPKPDVHSIKVEILASIQAKLVPKTIMREFFLHQYRTYEDFWLFRRQFAYQYAAVSFMTVMMSVNSRYPHKFLVNMATGNIWATEMLPIIAQTRQPPTYLNGEPVAFRLTPNLQTLMGQQVIEGVFAPTMMIIAKGLTEPEFDLTQFLPLFVRDELISWFAHQLNPTQVIPVGVNSEEAMQAIVKSNVDIIGRRAASLGQPGHSNSAANQTALDLISLAVNPRSLALTDILWMPYY